MKLILGFGNSGSGYYPYTQKPIDYQPYRPVYLFRGPPPDAGFSYGLFEDETMKKLYYADLGLEPYSPFTGKPSKLIKEVEDYEFERVMEKLLDNLEECECRSCGAKFKQNMRAHLKGREEYYCHRCGSKL